MIDELSISQIISEIVNLTNNKKFSTKVDGRDATIWRSSHSLAIAFFINDSWDVNSESLRYLSLFIGGHAELYDYALQLTTAGLWLCRCYKNNISTESLAIGIEQHIALTRLAENIVYHYSVNYSGKYYDDE